MRLWRAQRLQPLWERLHAASLAGMNFRDIYPATNGELWLLGWLAERSLLTSSPSVFDVGANVGGYSLALLERLPTARLYAFEPSAAAYARLEGALAGRAETFQVALGSKNETRPLYADSAGSPLASLHRRDLRRRGIEMAEMESVEVRRLDDLCCERAVDRIDLLKIDAEGSDLDVLRGAGGMLGAGISAIQFEFGGTAVDARQSLRDFFDLLESAGYRVHRLLPAGLWPLTWSERIEIAEYANYVALPHTGGELRATPVRPEDVELRIGREFSDT